MLRTIIALGVLVLSVLLGVSADEKPPRTDLYGDPLPEGAIVRFGTMRLRHANGASLAFAADSKRLLSAGTDKIIRFWDLETGKLLEEQRLPSQGEPGGIVAFSPDGALVAFQDPWVSDDLNLWDIDRKLISRTLEEKKFTAGDGWLEKVVFSPDSKTLVTARGNGDIRAWDVDTGQGRLVGRHKRDIQSLSFAADGTLVTSDMNKNIHFWDVRAVRERAHLTTADMFAGLTISPDGKKMAAFSFHNPEQDKGLRFLDSATGEVAKDWIAPDFKQIRSVRFMPDGKSVAIGIKDRLVIWDPVAGKAIHTLSGGKGGGYNLAFSHDGKKVAAFDNCQQRDPHGAMLYVWDLATGASHGANAIENGHRGEVNSVALSPDGRVVASLSDTDGSLRLWDAATARLLRSMPVEGTIVQNVVFSPDSKQVFAMTWPAIIAWDVATGSVLRRYTPGDDSNPPGQYLINMHLSPDGRTLVAASQISKAGTSELGFLAWEVATGKRLSAASFTSDDLALGYGRFKPDGRFFVDATGVVRETKTGTEWFRLPIQGKVWLGPVAVSRDGALVAIGVHELVTWPGGQRTKNEGVQVWELATALPVRRLETGPVGLAHVAFTPAGRHVITAGMDGLKLWDVASGKEIASHPAPGRYRGSYGSSFASSFALAADGHTVVTGQPDTTALLWDLSPPLAAAGLSQPLRTSAELDACWTELAGEDAGRAAVVISRLADEPQQALALLRERLDPIEAPSAEELRRLIAGLDDDSFARREACGKRLRELEELAEPALRKALENQPSLELRRRIEPLLGEFRIVRSPDSRRHLRAVRVLEAIGTPEARQVLENLAKGAPEARGTQSARDALERLARR
jgi:WD40 repeat protein